MWTDDLIKSIAEAESNRQAAAKANADAAARRDRERRASAPAAEQAKAQRFLYQRALTASSLRKPQLRSADSSAACRQTRADALARCKQANKANAVHACANCPNPNGTKAFRAHVAAATARHRRR